VQGEAPMQVFLPSVQWPPPVSPSRSSDARRGGTWRSGSLPLRHRGPGTGSRDHPSPNLRRNQPPTDRAEGSAGGGRASQQRRRRWWPCGLTEEEEVGAPAAAALDARDGTLRAATEASMEGCATGMGKLL
jgi:hypothetical protein